MNDWHGFGGMVRLDIDSPLPGRGFQSGWQDDSIPMVTQVITSSIDRMDSPGVVGAVVCHVRWTHVYFPADEGGALVIMGNNVGLYRSMEYAASACLN